MKTVKCPYNQAHIMPQTSLLNHLSKCSATNKKQFTKCKYNPVHVILKLHIDQHYQICKDKAYDFDSDDDWDQIPKPLNNSTSFQYHDSSFSMNSQSNCRGNGLKNSKAGKKQQGNSRHLISSSDSQLQSNQNQQKDQQQSYQSYTQKNSNSIDQSASGPQIKTQSSVSKLQNSKHKSSNDEIQLEVIQFQDNSKVQMEAKKQKRQKKRQKKNRDSFQLQVFEL